MKYFDVIFQFVLSIYFIFIFCLSFSQIKEVLKFAKLEIKKLKRKIVKNKVNENFVSDKSKVIFAEKILEDIYGENYNNDNSIGKKVEILVEDIKMEIDNIQIIPQHFLNSTYFEIKILISFEQYSKIQEEWFKKECTFRKTKKPQFFNIKYPVLTDTKDCNNWQEYKFVLNNLIEPQDEKNLFYKVFFTYCEE